MSDSVNRPAPLTEVKRLHDAASSRDEAVNKLHRDLDGNFRMAKAKVGAAIAAAIRDQPRKTYGHEGLMSGVCSGAKVPEYLARICDDPQARRRLALALLEGDDRVTVKTVVEWEDEKAG